MSTAVIRREAKGEWQVWVTLDDHDPIEDSFGFIVGVGATRDEAVRSAVADLEALVDVINGPPSGVEFRDDSAEAISPEELLRRAPPEPALTGRAIDLTGERLSV